MENSDLTSSEPTDAPTPEKPSDAPERQPEVAPDDVEARLAEVNDRWHRAAADLENARKRAAHELALARDMERVRAASVFLPVVDGLENAVNYAKEVNEGLAQGMQSIREQAIAALERLGYPRIDEVGVPFDPRIHEVVSVTQRPDTPQGTVVAVVRLGFGRPERLLRPAGVVVAAAGE